MLEQNFDEHKQGTVPSKGLALQNYKEKEAYLNYEVWFSLLTNIFQDRNYLN